MQGERLPTHIEALLSPAVYPQPVDRVELIQTHISYVFLAGDYVYKVKKPVDMGFLDPRHLRSVSCTAKRRFALTDGFARTPTWASWPLVRRLAACCSMAVEERSLTTPSR